MSLLAAQNLVCGYRGKPLLPGLDLAVEAGEFWCLFGRNGAGKTTLLRTLLGLQPPVSGSVTMSASVRVGYVPQRHEVDLTVPTRVIDLVRTGLDEGWSFLRPKVTGTQRRALAAALQRCDLQALERMPYRALSEGQKQRTLLARALVTSPELLVLDEPTSAMDRDNQAAVFEILTEIVQQGTAVFVISHDVERAAELSTHSGFVDKDQALALAGPTEEVLQHPAFIRQYGAVFAVKTTPPSVVAAAAEDGDEREPAVDPARLRENA